MKMSCQSSCRPLGQPLRSLTKRMCSTIGTPHGGSIVEPRFDAVDSRRMTSIWTTIREMYDASYAVFEGTVTDSPFLHRWED